MCVCVRLYDRVSVCVQDVGVVLVLGTSYLVADSRLKSAEGGNEYDREQAH